MGTANVMVAESETRKRRLVKNRIFVLVKSQKEVWSEGNSRSR
jgi:hypothetical protein